MSERAKVLDRIRQLREKTSDRGCTEQEALSAAAKAAELMAKYKVSEDDLVFEEATSEFSTKSHTALRKLWAVIAVCTNTSAVMSVRAQADVIKFYGIAPGPTIAAYLRDVCYRAARQAVGAFKAGAFYRRRRNTMTRKAAIADFLDAFANRLGFRLIELFEATISAETLSLASAHVEARFKTRSVDIRTRSERFPDAADEGYRAGGRVHLAHGVDGASTPYQVGCEKGSIR